VVAVVVKETLEEVVVPVPGWRELLPLEIPQVLPSLLVLAVKLAWLVALKHLKMVLIL
jgi:hypothetical protein|tara:strand:- start:677 stop:850 length:174 start_codon:yes stop_codon:yes gene_type:complete